MQLEDIIIKKINGNGPISFHDFMEMCLYFPDLGYYTSAHDTIGKRGDFYTSAYLTPAFGAMIARQLEEMWCILHGGSFTVVEYGAGTGFLCHDILLYLKQNSNLYHHLHYCIIEKSAVMRGIEKANLTGSNLSEKVSWYNSINDISGISGCILSNELVDNFSVHQVVMQNELMEIYVDYNNGFVEVMQPAGKALQEYIRELNIELPKGFRSEINLEATKWISDIATCLHSGYVITVDYGYLSEELYSNRRSQGTLVCYNKHSVNDCPYIDIGHQDITSHVNFSALDHWGMKSGLQRSGFTSQANFLLGLGLNEYLTKTMKEGAGFLNYKKNALLKYMLLVDMGNKYKVLIQQKGCSYHMLSGLKLANEPFYTAA
jgi:SAM-dependent MidA family methyltransferase